VQNPAVTTVNSAPNETPGLLLPSALLVTIGAQLLAALMLVDFGFPAFL
jgi:hypothetical protein